jgi:tRNA pseudouridine55 synthase
MILLNKPEGIGSRMAGKKVARLYGQKKFGHVGTLDPMATGVMAVLLGNATKLSQFLVEGDKKYRARIEFGVVTDSYDRDGEVLAQQPVPELSRNDLDRLLEDFRGRIAQRPPAISAVKVGGIASHKLARKGESVELPLRTVEISNISVLAYEEPFLDVEIDCSKGTYIRSIAHDLGQKIGCGACLAALVRLESRPFLLDDAISLPQLEEATEEERMQRLVPLDACLSSLQHWHATPALEEKLKDGNLPSSLDFGKFMDQPFEEDEQIVVVGARKIAIMKAMADSQEARKLAHPFSYCRVIERGLA